MIRLILGLPAYRGEVHAGHVRQAAALGALCAVAKDSVTLTHVLDVDSCLVDYARNELLFNAIRRDADWLLMMDADTYHEHPVDLVRMIEEGIRRKAAVIAAPVKRRKSDSYNVIREQKLLTKDEFTGKVLEVDRIGTACMAIRCGWIVKHWPEQPWFTTMQLAGRKPQARGEDFVFCDEVRSRHGMVLCDGRFEPTHVGA